MLTIAIAFIYLWRGVAIGSARALESAAWLVEPETGIGPVHLFMSKAAVEKALGPADQVVGDGSWWYYASAGLIVVFLLIIRTRSS